ncbi:MAG: 50S ribosomal protein L15 [Planctomycetes bacterium]|nr:50S ribosomal protein L15 [Planctomycetota bacterium]
MELNDINAKVGRRGNRRRIGRGPGSGWGQTAGRGDKGAGSRSGFKRRLNMDGGQMTFIKRIAKRGFTNARFKREWSFVNLSDLNVFEDGEVVTSGECLKRGVIPKVRDGLKVLGVGKLEKKLTIRANRASKSAVAAIAAAGGTLELIPANGDLAKENWKAKRKQGRRTLRKKAAQARDN